MPEPAKTKSQRLHQLAFELETLADRVDEPSRSIHRAELLISEGERIAGAIRTLFRGR